ncbi:L-fucose:H+ symporter permease [Rhizosphaericola mali]|uniref:L-fucose:H+ symporter permease n=1 Tax=Rhizosphaericola mali TaxID=2545455 RepID=A0A5P2G4K2_9BACT|nr:L-fucose:H+ symporter permease [Rhizosphaericola mali]QES89079.1 L-fucose:H+ symporter permease [Rhizosphaericola mali]
MNSKNKLSIALLTSLFFFWGFIHNLDPILIPHLRNAFNLSHLQSSFIDSSVYVAYFFMAIPAGIIMRKAGYKNGIISGLLLFGIGCFLFVPAANSISYPFFLTALFIVACGLTTLETAANPYVAVLGDPEKGPQRLNFAQSFNGLAAFLAPIIGGKFILTNHVITPEELSKLSDTARRLYIQSETSTVKMPYVILGIIILILAAVFYFVKLPSINQNNSNTNNIFQALKIKNVKSAITAQFFYIGAQVCILSFIVVFATEVVKINSDNAPKYAGYAGLAFLLGRFFGTFLMRFFNATKLLIYFSLIAFLLTIYIVTGQGITTLFAIIGVAFCMSIMYPTIFALGIQGAGNETESVSSLIVMSIVGGAVLPPLLGWISDKTGIFQWGYVVPAFCFLIVLIFAIKNRNYTLRENKIGGH